MLSREIKTEIQEKIKSGLTHQQVYDELKSSVDEKQELARVIQLIPSNESFMKLKPLQFAVVLALLAYILFGVYTIQFFDAPLVSDKHYWIKFILYVVAMLTAVGVYRFKNQRIKLLVILTPVFYMNFLNQVIAPQFTNFSVANLVLFILLTVLQAIYMHRLVKDIFINAD